MNHRTLKSARLEIAYLEHGPAGGPAAVLLHGFPDDATSWKAVMEELAMRGVRSYAPFIRGFGGTRFLDDATPRAGDFAALGQDALDFVDALALRDFVVVGQDWGSPAAEIVAMQGPDRVRRLVKLNWYGVYTMAELARAQGFGYAQLRTLWYVWMLNTPLGKMVLDDDRRGFAEVLWEEWSPSWPPRDRAAALESVTPSFDNRDFSRVVLSSYRNGISDAERDPADEPLRQQLNDPPPVMCETVIVRGEDDGVERSPLSAEARARYFRGGCRVEELPGVGHFPQREAPRAVASAVVAPSGKVG